MTAFFEQLANWIWGLPLLVLLVGTGVYLTFLLRAIQFRTLLYSLHLGLIVRKDPGEGEISHFQALMTALAATVGTGNIAGVATAIATGGPGALFWMWVTGFFGMATKFGEAVLAVKYRTKNAQGEVVGGPMYYLSMGLPWKRLGAVMGTLFAVFAAIAAFGIGNMVQSNSVADAIHSTFGIPTWITGITLALLTGLVILGGIRSIGKVTAVFIPMMIIFYTGGALVLLVLNWSEIPAAFGLIFKYAFQPTAAAGGFLGAVVAQTIRMGVSRGVFSNESGLGSSPIAAAAAKTNDPVRQALVSMTQTFIDTIVICTMTGLAIITTGAWMKTDAAGKALNGAPLTAAAFATGLPFGGELIVTLGLIFFAYSTILGWSYYGEKSIEYLFGSRLILPYRMLFVSFIFVGAVVKLNLVWNFADAMNGLMALPNLIGLLLLSPIIASETRRYLYEMRQNRTSRDLPQ
jgi:AGCS family alanine or glycine:cation symporter